MQLHLHAQRTPDKPALIMAQSGEIVTFAQLERCSQQGSQLFRTMGLQSGDGIALLSHNCRSYLEAIWAAHRAGLRYTCLSSYLTAPEAEYIIRDCGARALLVSESLVSVAATLAQRLPSLQILVFGAPAGGFQSFEQARERMPATRIADEANGVDMLYSSGTTGKPKGVRRPLPEGPFDTPFHVATLAAQMYGMNANVRYLSPAPLYHAAPLCWAMAALDLGGTAVVMERFDAASALAYIERYRITHAQWVPTHFVRMLKLPLAIRRAHDLSSLEVAIHAAAPCPVPIKEQMIEWWGPILEEYYSGTEGAGMTRISSDEWLQKKGSVGRAYNCEMRIFDDAGQPLPVHTVGMVRFRGSNKFQYHNDPEKTASATTTGGWTTLGDVGRMDEDGYLYLVDRASFMIISGGVNIYPQEIENVLTMHPKVADVAVIGAPDEEMGERVVAVVQPLEWRDAGPALREELLQFARGALSAVKMPRVVDFMESLPRHENGKLYKRLLRDAYSGGKSSMLG